MIKDAAPPARERNQLIDLIEGGSENDAFQRGLASSSETLTSLDRVVGRRVDGLRASGEPVVRAFLDQLVDRLGTGTDHPKVAATVEWVARQVGEGHHVAVFTSWLPTRDAIGKALIEAGIETWRPSREHHRGFAGEPFQGRSRRAARGQ